MDVAKEVLSGVLGKLAPEVRWAGCLRGVLPNPLPNPVIRALPGRSQCARGAQPRAAHLPALCMLQDKVGIVLFTDGACAPKGFGSVSCADIPALQRAVEVGKACYC